MRRRLMVGGAIAAALCAVVLTRGAGSVHVTPPRAAAAPQTPPSGDPPRLIRPQPPPSRNVFAYADRVERAASSPRSEEGPSTKPAPPTPAPAHFVGFVRRGGSLRAALSILGEIVVLGPGEESGGYAVLSIDEDGVRLRAPDGGEISLQPPPS